MVGNNMFTVQLNNRLKDLKGSKEDFGGVSIITLGDLFQLIVCLLEDLFAKFEMI